MFRWPLIFFFCTDADLKNFVWELGKEGFVLQLISLAGLHSNAAATGNAQIILLFSRKTNTLFCAAELSERFKTDGMLAYVELVQRKEKEIGCDVLTHQKWCVNIQSDFRLTHVFIGAERIT